MVQNQKQQKALKVISYLMVGAALIAFVLYLLCAPDNLRYAIKDIRKLGGDGMFSGLEGLVVMAYGFVSVIMAIPFAILDIIAAVMCRRQESMAGIADSIQRIRIFFATNILLYLAAIVSFFCFDSGVMLISFILALTIASIVLTILFFTKTKQKPVPIKKIKRLSISLLIIGIINVIAAIFLISNLIV